MAARTYFNSAFPEPWQILGVRLRPFSLGHFFKLRQFKNAFVAEEPSNASLGDLLLGVSVCSMSSHPDPAQDEFWVWWNEPSKSSRLAKLFGKQPMTPAEREIYRWGKRIGQFDVSEKSKMFAAYIERHSETPAYWPLEESKGGKSGAHWSHAVLSGLVSECGYTQLEAYNVPVSKALMDYFKACEAQGTVRLMTEEEQGSGTFVLAGGENGA